MRKISLYFFLCTIILSSTAFSNEFAFEKRVPFKIYFEQDNIRIPIISNTVSLSKKPFNIVFVWDKPNGILISTSFNKETYEKALKNVPISKLPGYKETGMAESNFNTDNEVLISDDAPSYWFYDSANENRFNKVIKSKDSIICSRTINRVYLVDKQSTLSIEQLKEPLYFVFMDYESNPKTYERIEFQREMVKVNWK